MNDLLNGKVRFEGIKGVGTIEVDFVPNQRVYTFIGANGVGKTKLLECLFTVLFLTYKDIMKSYVETTPFLFKKVISESIGLNQDFSVFRGGIDHGKLIHEFDWQKREHRLPVIYLAAHGRGFVNSKNFHSGIASYQKRKEDFILTCYDVFNMPENFKYLNMAVNIQEWVIHRAQSANPYQAKEDNRKVEIDTLLSILNQIDARIDSEFLEISGDNRVFIKVSGDKRELSELSSGFTSLLKIVQSIISGYSYFTNEQQIARVRGVVLIDEIESHLHNEWQVKIVPLLKKLFPNTTFVITTHSSLVISQLEQGEAYRLKRSKEDGVVYGEAIDYPSQASFVDLLNEAFGVDLNSLKIERAKEHGQQQAKKALLDLVNQELGKSGA